MGRLSKSSMLYRVLAWIEARLYASADQIVVLADGVGQAIRELGIDSERIHLIPNGAEPLEGSTEDREAGRAAFGFTDFVCAYTGAHGPANGLDLLLDAAKDVASTDPRIRIVLVGDGPAKPALVERARDEGITNVVFLPAMQKDEVPRLLQAADCGLHVLADVPLFHYGVSPNKLMDYMAAGLPALTNTPGEVARIVESAEAGLAVAPHALAEGLREMAAASEDQRRVWGAGGISFIREQRSVDRLAPELEEVLDGAGLRRSCG
jgi:glycosyltransferase involved in cell wall biosynthesis